jgi:hypothetical protein
LPFIFSRATRVIEVKQSRTNGRGPKDPERCSLISRTNKHTNEKRTLSWTGCPQRLYRNGGGPPRRVNYGGAPGGEVRDTGVISNDLQAVEKWIGRLRKAHGKETQLRACYEAGPCGFGLARRLQLGVECEAVAPSMTPTRSGDRVKTDKRDARKRKILPVTSGGSQEMGQENILTLRN